MSYNPLNELQHEEDVGFSMISHALIAAVELKPSDKLVFQFLLSCQVRSTFLWAIQKGWVISGNTVIRSLANLQKYNLLTIEKLIGLEERRIFIKQKKKCLGSYLFNTKSRDWQGEGEREGYSKGYNGCSKRVQRLFQKGTTVVPKGYLEEQPRITKENNNKRPWGRINRQVWHKKYGIITGTILGQMSLPREKWFLLVEALRAKEILSRWMIQLLDIWRTRSWWGGVNTLSNWDTLNLDSGFQSVLLCQDVRVKVKYLDLLFKKVVESIGQVDKETEPKVLSQNEIPMEEDHGLNQDYINPILFWSSKRYFLSLFFMS